MTERRPFSMVRLRPATARDEAFVLRVRNQKSSRRASFNSHLITPPIHHLWYSNAIKDPYVRVFIIECGREPSGVLRINRLTEKTGEIHLAVLSSRRRQGIGAMAVSCFLIENVLRSDGWDLETVIARIKNNNSASLSFFGKLGFEPFNSKSLALRNGKVLAWTQKAGKKTAGIILDAGSTAGMGHLMRQSALAKELERRGYACAVWMRCPKNERKIGARFFSKKTPIFYSPGEFLSFLNHQTPRFFIIDVLQVPSRRLFAPLAERGVPAMFVGNYERVPGWVKAYFNPYSRSRAVSAQTRRVENSSCVVLSPEFSSRTKRKIKKEGKNLLVLPGGGNTGGMVFKILDALNPLPVGHRVSLVMGPYFTMGKKLAKRLRRFEGRIQLFQGISPASMCRLMREADAALLSFGRSLDEARFLGLPVLLLSSSPLNRMGSLYAEKKGGAAYLGDWRVISRQKLRTSVLQHLKNFRKRSVMSIQGSRLVDGRGAERTVDCMEKFAA